MLKKSSVALAVIAASLSLSAFASPEGRAERAQYRADVARVDADYRHSVRDCHMRRAHEQRACLSEARDQHDHALADLRADRH